MMQNENDMMTYAELIDYMSCVLSQDATGAKCRDTALSCIAFAIIHNLYLAVLQTFERELWHTSGMTRKEFLSVFSAACDNINFATVYKRLCRKLKQRSKTADINKSIIKYADEIFDEICDLDDDK
ncbi:hypothetical protein [Rhodobacter capsulatus]|uniref:hypothetical protein n=1 Tax=Rhodobacter capsulatus TaxID=1061 RepID=UPI00402A5D88